MKDPQRPPIRGSLQNKLLRTLLGVVVLVGIGTLSVVSYWSARTSRNNLSDISGHIEAQLDAKGRGLVENQTLALKGMLQDNAFSDIELLIARTVEHDPDILYGVVTDAEGQKLAFSARDTPTADARLKAPWQAIALPEVLPTTRELTSRPVRAKGEDVVEIAAPILVDKEVVGALRYGLSTRKMQEALSAARARARADLMLTLFSICGLVVVVGAAGMFLGRREASRIVRPLTALTVAARALARGDRDVRVEIRSGDELELLGTTFDQMAADLATSYKALENLNQGLEVKVEERTAALGSRNRDMRLVLDNVAQGLITIDATGVIAQERSQVVEKWFGPMADGVSLPDYLAASAQNFSENLRMALMQLADGDLPSELCLQQLPERFAAEGREYKLVYAAIGDEEPVRGVLVMIEDITDAMALQREELAQREVLRAVQHLTRDRGGFLSFIREVERLFEQICRESDLEVRKRAIHTLKGNSSLFGLERVAGFCHQLEDEMAITEGPPSETGVAQLTRCWSDLMESLSPFLGQIHRDVVEVPRAELETLLASLRTSTGVQEVRRFLQSLTLEPVRRPLERLAEQARGLATRLGRGEITCAIEVDDTRLDAEAWAPFWSAMSHVVRNAVDHGLETPSERAAAGKGTAKLTFHASTKGHETAIVVSDDGRGISWERLREKMRAAGLPSTTRADLLNAMLMDGITTRDKESETSGRGVGMAAVKDAVQCLGGKLDVDSAPDRGTRWTFVIPTHTTQGKKPVESGAEYVQ